MVTQQAQIIAYIDDYKFLLFVTLAVLPLLLFFRKGSDSGTEHSLAVE